MRFEDHPARYEFFNEAFGLFQSDSTSIFSHHLVPWVKCKTEETSDKHQNEESHVSSIIDPTSIAGTRVPVLADRNCCTNDNAWLEDGPENGNVKAFLIFRSKRSDCRPFCNPQKCRRKPTPSTCKLLSDKLYFNGYRIWQWARTYLRKWQTLYFRCG